MSLWEVCSKPTNTLTQQLARAHIATFQSATVAAAENATTIEL